MPKKAIKDVDETKKSTKTKTVKATSKTVKTAAKKTSAKKTTAPKKETASTKKAPVKKTTTAKKAATPKKTAAKNTATKKTTTPKKETASVKKTTTKKTTATKKVATTKKATTAKKTATKKTATPKKVVTKKTTTTKKAAEPKKTTTAKKATVKKETKATKKADEVKTKTTVTKKATTKKAASKKTATVKKATTPKKETATKKKVTTKKTSTVKKTTAKKATAKKTTTKKVTKAEPKKTALEKYANVLEYYDLPYRYNETVVKILAQTPKVLFVYWDISDADREFYSTKYGEYFFNDTYPVLLVHNKTLNYTDEVEINDFANSWYISIPDARSEYTVELARRFKDYAKRNPAQAHKEDLNTVISVASSNDITMPNDHVLIDELKPQVKYRNVKTGEESYKNIKNILADKKLIDFYNLYKKIYNVEDLGLFFDLDNPSSGNPTSTFK